MAQYFAHADAGLRVRRMTLHTPFLCCFACHTPTLTTARAAKLIFLLTHTCLTHSTYTHELSHALNLRILTYARSLNLHSLACTYLLSLTQLALTIKPERIKRGVWPIRPFASRGRFGPSGWLPDFQGTGASLRVKRAWAVPIGLPRSFGQLSSTCPAQRRPKVSGKWQPVRRRGLLGSHSGGFQGEVGCCCYSCISFKDFSLV